MSVGRHPHESEGFDDAGLDELRELSRAPEGARDRRGGPRLQARLRAARGPAALVHRPDRAGARARPAARGPHPRGGRRHARPARRATPTACRRDHPLLLAHRPRRRVRRARLLLLVRRQRHLSEGDRPPARPRARFRTSCCWPRPTRRSSRRRSGAASRTSPPTCARPRASWPSCAAPRRRRWSVCSTPTPRACSTGERDRAPACDRLARHGIRPNRELGQNFLVDDNILEVIGRAAELDADDVVLEIGGGLGVLSAYLAAARRATCT